jgi:hypothetical protein
MTDRTMKNTPPQSQHTAYRDDLIAVLRKHSHLSPQELLAISSHLVGQLIALQDQWLLTAEEAMTVVMRNIEQGNRDAIGDLKRGIANGKPQ